MSGSGSERPIDLRFFRMALRRRRRLLVACTLVGAIVGISVALLLPSRYSGSSLVLFGSPSEAQAVASGASRLDIETNAQIATSDAVLGAALTASDSSLELEDLRGRVRVSTPTDSLLKIEVSDEDAARALELARTIAQSHVDYVEQIAAPATDEAVRLLSSRIADLEEQADQLDAEIAAARDRQSNSGGQGTATSQEAELIGALSTQRAELSILLSQLEAQLEAATASGRDAVGLSARVLDDPGVPSSPDVTRTAVIAGALGAAIGLVVAVALAMRTAVRDPAIWSTDEVRRVLGAPVVAGIGSRPQRDPDGWRRLLVSYQAPPVDAWAVRRTLRWLQTTAQSGSSDSGEQTGQGRERVTLIVLAADSRGQSLAAVLATTSAALGTRVALCPLGSEESGSTIEAGLAQFRRGQDTSSPLTVSVAPSDLDDRMVFFLAVVDPRQDVRAELPATATTLLCLGPGASTVEELSRLALSWDRMGNQIDGVLVADPSDWDQSLSAAPATWSSLGHIVDPDEKGPRQPKQTMPRSGA